MPQARVRDYLPREYTDVWSGTHRVPTITGQCYGFGNGRFGHPKQERALSLREAAILQTFPKKYSFVPKITSRNEKRGPTYRKRGATAAGQSNRIGNPKARSGSLGLSRQCSAHIYAMNYEANKSSRVSTGIGSPFGNTLLNQTFRIIDLPVGFFVKLANYDGQLLCAPHVYSRWLKELKLLFIPPVQKPFCVGKLKVMRQDAVVQILSKLSCRSASLFQERTKLHPTEIFLPGRNILKYAI